MKSKIITCDDILGKEVLDPHGSILGVITKVHINVNSKSVVGLTVDMGLLKPDLFVGVNYIKHFGVDAVLLNKMPAEKLTGLKVLKFDGEPIGTVKDVVKSGAKIKELVVVTNLLPVIRKEIIVPYTSIKQIGVSIILKKDFKIKT
jgi:sporulation protein YlmC with PRC-barrel domain